MAVTSDVGAGAVRGQVIERRVDPRVDRYLERHRLGPKMILSSSMILELVTSAVAEVRGDDRFSVGSLRFERPVGLSSSRESVLKIEIAGGGALGSEILCRAQSPSGSYTVHARAVVMDALTQPAAPAIEGHLSSA